MAGDIAFNLRGVQVLLSINNAEKDWLRMEVIEVRGGKRFVRYCTETELIKFLKKEEGL